MSLNRYEQAIFDYWERQPDEKRHWHSKVIEMTRQRGPAAENARALERELGTYARERSAHVPSLREYQGVGRVSLLNLAEHLLRIWAPVTQAKQPSRDQRRGT